LRQNLKKSMDNCQNLCNDLKLRDTTIKSLKSEIEQLRKNFEENNKKLSRSEKEIDILKQREAKLLENIRQVLNILYILKFKINFLLIKIKIIL